MCSSQRFEAGCQFRIIQSAFDPPRDGGLMLVGFPGELAFGPADRQEAHQDPVAGHDNWTLLIGPVFILNTDHLHCRKNSRDIDVFILNTSDALCFNDTLFPDSLQTDQQRDRPTHRRIGYVVGGHRLLCRHQGKASVSVPPFGRQRVDAAPHPYDQVQIDHGSQMRRH